MRSEWAAIMWELQYNAEQEFWRIPIRKSFNMGPWSRPGATKALRYVKRQFPDRH